jgi:hypothetical protein
LSDVTGCRKTQVSDCTSSTVYIFKCIFSLKIIKTKVKLDKIMDLVCWLVALEIILKRFKGTIEWSWLYGSWFYNYLWNQWLSPLTSWVWIPLRWGVLDTTLSDKCQWLDIIVFIEKMVQVSKCVKYVKIRWFCVEKVRIEALKGKIFNFNENKCAQVPKCLCYNVMTLWLAIYRSILW